MMRQIDDAVEYNPNEEHDNIEDDDFLWWNCLCLNKY